MAGAAMNVNMPGAWMLDGDCASTDPELFYPEKGGSAQPAKRVCAGCPVRITCAEFALTGGDPHGVYGGLSERDRRRLLAAGWQLGDALPEPPPRRMEPCTLCHGQEYRSLVQHMIRAHGHLRGAA